MGAADESGHPTPDPARPEPARKRRPSGVYIKQAGEIVGVSPSILRSWETESLISPARTDSGYRVYSPSDIERLRRLRDLRERNGLNPAGARLILKESNGDGEAAHSRRSKPHVSDRIRVLRKRKGISLRKLAELSGLSASSVSAIERGISAPSVGTLRRLAAALETTVPQLLDTAEPRRNLVVRPHERRQLKMEAPGVLFENLYTVDTTLQSILISVEPGHGSQESYSHDGEEFLYILTGTLELTLNEIYSYQLEAGDAMTFQSTRPHRWHNPGEERTVIVWVNTPPTF